MLSTVVLTGDTDMDVKALKDATGEKGAHAFVDYRPSSLKAELLFFMAGIKSLQRGGEFILLGGVFADLKPSYQEIMPREVKSRGKFMYQREHIERFLRMVEIGNLKIGPEAGSKDGFKYCSLDQVEEALNTNSGWAFGDQSLFTHNK